MGDRLKCQLYGPLSVLSKGLLSKSQKLRFCVFLVAPDGSSPQIHVFDKEEHFRKNSKDRKIFHLNGIQKLQYTKDRYGFDVITKREKFSFVAENSHDLRKWMGTLKVDLNISTILEPDGSAVSDEEESDSHLYMDDNIIYESAEVTPMFSVTIEDSEVARRCQLSGEYLLVVNQHNLALVDCGTKKAIFQWPYKYIRRFGKTRTNFQFEAGRKCPSGEGEFTFLTEHGFKIFEAFSKTTQRIRSFDDEQINPTHGHVRAKSDGQNGQNQASVLRSSGRSVSGVPGVSDVHPKPERKSVKSGGSVGHVPDFTSELNSVLKHKDEHLPGGAVAHPPEPTLKDSKKEKSKKPEKPEKKTKKEKEKEEKAREKELRAQEKAREKEEKMKEKEKDKKGKKKKVEATVSQPYKPTHAYEDVDDIAEILEPEPLYAEADAVATPATKPTPRNIPKPELYSEPQKLKKDAWKQHGREEQDSVHQEDYDSIRVAASKLKDVHINPPIVIDEEPDMTYDHIGNISPHPPAKAEESIYGTASGKSIASIRKEKEMEKAGMHEYEEAAPKSAPKGAPKKKPAPVDQYEEPATLGIRLPAEGEEENGYADVQNT